MFRAFGHEKSSVLDGGLPRWVSDGYPVDNGLPAKAKRTTYPVPLLRADEVKGTHISSHLFRKLELFLGYEQMVTNSFLDLSQDATVQLVLDARSHGR
jgi:thiosulfate/3-mercaptopyruvate sulfurtransferase